MNYFIRTVLLICFSIAVAACDNDSSFIEKGCTVTESDTFRIVFSSEAAIRTLSINKKRNDITFKGTTLNDRKWRTELDKVGKFVISRENLIRAEFKDGKRFHFGIISEKCKKLAGEHFGELLQIE